MAHSTKFAIFLALLYSASFFVVQAQEAEIQEYVNVTLKTGTVRGYSGRADNNDTTFIFKGIPFGKPPVGQLRFKAPEPAEAWEGILDGTKAPPSCPQYLTGGAEEDCLYLNVYTKRRGNESTLAPVMVFMYGGGFALGGINSYAGPKLLQKDVVLVVANYRVNIMGFLATGDEVLPGNYGLKDQNLALRWVQENIKSFGGDANKVTIFGESAGGSSVTFHLLSPASRGLFHGVIAQSGTALSPWALDHEPLKSAQRIAQGVGCAQFSTSKQIYDCMVNMDVAQITETFFWQMLGDLMKSTMAFKGNTPVVEPDLPGAFLTEDPLKLLKEGRFADVPVIIGATSHEGALVLGGFHFLSFGMPNVTKDTLENPVWMREDMMNQLLSTYELSDNGLAVPVEEVMALAYFPGRNRIDFKQVSSGLTNMMSVIGMKGPIKKTADLISKKATSNVYMYSFEYMSENRRNTYFWYIFQLVVPIVGGVVPDIEHGAIHMDDLIYLFPGPFILEEEDTKFSNMLCELWTNFAIHGTPTPQASDEYPQWSTYSIYEPNYLKLDQTPTMQVDITQEWVKTGPRRNR